MIWVHCYVLWDCVSSRFDSKRRRQDGVCSGNRFIWWRRSIEKSNFSTILHLDWIDTKWLKLAEELKRGPPSIFSQRMWVVSIGSWTPRCFLFTYYTEIAYVSENKKVACLKVVPHRQSFWMNLSLPQYHVEYEPISNFEFNFQSIVIALGYILLLCTYRPL